MISEVVREKRRRLSQRVKDSGLPIRPGVWTLVGVACLGAAIAVGVWGYPELRRTIQMHTM